MRLQCPINPLTFQKFTKNVESNWALYYKIGQGVGCFVVKEKRSSFFKNYLLLWRLCKFDHLPSLVVPTTFRYDNLSNFYGFLKCEWTYSTLRTTLCHLPRKLLPFDAPYSLSCAPTFVTSFRDYHVPKNKPKLKIWHRHLKIRWFWGKEETLLGCFLSE